MAAPKKREMIDTLMRLVRTPQERAARVKAVIHERWRRELRRTRYRGVLMILALVTVAALITMTVALRWIRAWLP